MQRLFHYVGLSAASHELFKNKNFFFCCGRKSALALVSDRYKAKLSR